MQAKLNNYNYTAPLSDLRSQLYYQTATVVQSEFLMIIRYEIPEAAAVEVTSFSNGSVTVNFIVHMNKTFTDDGSAASHLSYVIYNGNYSTLFLVPSFNIIVEG